MHTPVLSQPCHIVVHVYRPITRAVRSERDRKGPSEKYVARDTRGVGVLGGVTVTQKSMLGIPRVRDIPGRGLRKWHDTRDLFGGRSLTYANTVSLHYFHSTNRFCNNTNTNYQT